MSRSQTISNEEKLAALMAGAVSAVDLGSLGPARAEEEEIVLALRRLRRVVRKKLAEQDASKFVREHRRAALQRMFDQVFALDARTDGAAAISSEKAQRVRDCIGESGLLLLTRLSTGDAR